MAGPLWLATPRSTTHCSHRAGVRSLPTPITESGDSRVGQSTESTMHKSVSIINQSPASNEVTFCGRERKCQAAFFQAAILACKPITQRHDSNRTEHSPFASKPARCAALRGGRSTAAVVNRAFLSANVAWFPFWTRSSPAIAGASLLKCPATATYDELVGGFHNHRRRITWKTTTTIGLKCKASCSTLNNRQHRARRANRSTMSKACWARPSADVWESIACPMTFGSRS